MQVVEIDIMRCAKCGNVFTEKSVTIGMVEGNSNEKVLCPVCGSADIEEY